MSEDRPLTRRELRLKKLAEERGRSAQPQDTAANATEDRPLSRRELRAQRLQNSVDTSTERAVTEHEVRRRPVVTPATTSNIPIVDPETGSIAAVEIPVVGSTPQAPEPEAIPVTGDSSSDTSTEEVGHSVLGDDPGAILPPELSFEDVLSGQKSDDVERGATPAPRWRPVEEDEFAAIVAHPAVAHSDRADSTADTGTVASSSVPVRTSLRDRVTEPRGAAEEADGPELTVEQAALRAPSAGMTVLRYVVLILAMFLVGGLIWLIAQNASAAPIESAISWVAERMLT